MIPESASSLIRQELQHPYLFFSAEDMPALREQCKRGRSAAVYRKIKGKVDRALDDGFPASPPREQCYRHGRWEEYSRATGLAKKLVLDCAFVAVIEDNDSYTETAWEWVTDYMRWPSWVHTAHEFGLIDLDSTHTCAVMVAAYDFLYDRWSDDRRKELEYIVHQRGLAYCIDGGLDKIGWASAYQSNWCSVCCSSMGIAALGLLRSPRCQSFGYGQVVDECARRVWRFLDNVGEDGSWKEGVVYWGYGIGMGVGFMHCLKRATGGAVDLFQHPRLHKSLEFPLNCLLPPDKAVGFCDSYDTILDYLVFKKFAQEFNDPRALWYDRKIGNDYGGHEDDIYGVLWEPNDLQPSPPDADPPSVYFPDAGWCIMRSDWKDEDASVLALKIGSTCDPHGHADVGNFIIHTHGETAVCELGIGRYGDPRSAHFIESIGHNVPLFDGQTQRRDQPRPGRVEQVRLGREQDYVCAEIAPAYDLAHLTSFRRHFLFLRPDVFVVLDEYQVSRPVEIDWRVHYQGEMAIERQTAIVRKGQAQVLVRILSPAQGEFLRDEHKNLAYMEFRKNVPTSSPYLRFLHRGEQGRARIVAAFVCGGAEDDLAACLEGIQVGDGPDLLTISSPSGTRRLIP
jgi:hypothetical protein